MDFTNEVLEQALADYEQCLEVDVGYLNCQQHRAESLLLLGRIEEGVRQFESTFESNFHSVSDAFVSYYVHTGQRKMALLVAALAIRNPFAPVKDWIEAIEHPDQDHSARVARFNQWGETHNIEICEMDIVQVAMRREDCFTTITNARMMWHPDILQSEFYDRRS